MSGPPPGTRVLIVEDETIIALLAEEMVEDMGCVVAATASTLAEALDASALQDFAVAMLDINLHGQMSLPVAERLRAAGKPFVFTTGYGGAIAGAAFPGTIIIHKPYDAAMLAEAIGRALAGG